MEDTETVKKTTVENGPSVIDSNLESNSKDLQNHTEKDVKSDPQEDNTTTSEGEATDAQESNEGDTFTIYIRTCGEKKQSIQLQVSPTDNLQDIRQFLLESTDTCYITSYSLFLNGQKLNDFSEISEIEAIKPGCTLDMQEAQYDERSLRVHVKRLREIMMPMDLTSSPSMFSAVCPKGVDLLAELTEAEATAANESQENGKENSNDADHQQNKKHDKKHDKKSNSNNTNLTDDDKVDAEVDLQSLLSQFYPAAVHNTPHLQCVKSITYSGWNPPPSYRKLVGDLVYLDIVTLENRAVSVTGSTNGFFVNGTTANNFNPYPSGNLHSHTLVGLLNKLSPTFKKNLNTLLSANAKKHPFEMLPVLYPVTPWTAKKEKHSFDASRAEDALLYNADIDTRGLMRDWNEEYQSCKELPSETIQERIMRDRAIVKINCDFVDAATKGAVAIIDRTVPPINPLDPEKAHMYIYNNIFFSYATDGRDFYKDIGGDKAAYASVSNDLKGIIAFNKSDVKGLYTLATAVIDYRGKRLCAQSIIPGILQREQTSTVVYGSMDNGGKIAFDETFHELCCKAAKQLHIKEHTVIDSENNSIKLALPVEAKGILGTDGRRYILDLIRVTPRDANYSGKTHTLTILRPELVALYQDHLKEMKLKEKLLKQQQDRIEKAKQAQAAAEQATTPADGKTEQTTNETQPATPTEAKSEEATQSDDKKTEEKTEKSEEKSEDSKPSEANGEVKSEGQSSATATETIEISEEEVSVYFNPNVLCEYKLGGSAEETAQDEELVKKLASFLVDMVIPGLVEEFSWFLSVPVDGQTLTSVMHSRGINMRYLGKLCTLTTHLPMIQDIAIREMLTRAAKHVLRAILAEVDDSKLAPTIAHFLNCFLGNVTEAHIEKPVAVKKQGASGKKKKKSKAAKQKNPLTMTTASLYEQLKAEIQERFQYEMKERAAVATIIQNVPTLRSICQKVGIQVEAKDYDFTLPTPFTADDILKLYPVVKHTDPESSDGHNLLEAGKSFLAQGRLDITFELLTESLAIFHQVYGPMHKDTANCYSNLAMVLYYAKDYVQALDHQQKAVIINERVLGMDHHDTAHSYGNLALFCHNMGHPKVALSYIKRALYLGRLVCGPNHPDIVTTFTNIAMMLQDLKKHKEAIAYLLEALKCAEYLFGPNHIETAAIYHTIAIAHSQMNQFKEALSYEKKNYAILHAKVGDNDLRAIESNIYLKQFTAKAVQAQIETKKMQRTITSQLSNVKLDKLKNNLQGGKAKPPASISAAAAEIAMGSRSVSEILSFINSGKTPTGKSFLQRNQKGFQSSAFANGTTKRKSKKQKIKKKEAAEEEPAKP